MASNSWQRNLAASFVAELLAMAAFTFVDPLIPLYIQKVGNLSTTEAAFWAGIAASGLGVAMFFVSPFWGILADRFGRKLMVLRAMFGGAIVLSLMGVAPNVYTVVILRWFQGLLTGSVAATTALVSSVAPAERRSFAIGIIMLAVFSGQSIGPLVGGFVADRIGYQFTFHMSGVFLLLGGIIMATLVNENFQKPAQSKTFSLRDMFRLSLSSKMLPLLTIMCLMSIGQALVAPITSLRVKELTASQAATVTGIIASFGGILAAISSIASGRLGDRISPPKIMAFSCFGIALFFLPPVWAETVGLFATSLILTGLVRGGLATSTNAMIGSSVAIEQQGIAYGLGQSASSLGGGVGPIIGGSLAGAMGLKPIFGIGAGVLTLSGILTLRWLKKQPAAGERR